MFLTWRKLGVLLCIDSNCDGSISSDIGTGANSSVDSDVGLVGIGAAGNVTPYGTAVGICAL